MDMHWETFSKEKEGGWNFKILAMALRFEPRVVFCITHIKMRVYTHKSAHIHRFLTQALEAVNRGESETDYLS
jgi:hypothetical protein